MKPEDILQQLPEPTAPEQPYKRKLNFSELKMLRKHFKMYSFCGFIDDFNRILLGGGEGVYDKSIYYVEPQDLLKLN